MGPRVILAGHNLDAQALEARLAGQGEAEAGALSPETLSAAYARISRDPREVGELRAEARREVQRARRSNQAIIFEMGHASVAEHAAFNLDVLGVSRLVVESLEHHRLASYTEKSQRYIRLEGEYVCPPELMGSPLEPAFRARVEALGRLYQELASALTARAAEEAGVAGERLAPRALASRANEDARYVLPLCAEAQLGLTMNARSLELAIARLASHPLGEARALGQALFEAIEPIAPSLVRYIRWTPYFRDTGPALEGLARGLIGRPALPRAGHPPMVHLAGFTPEPDREVAAALLFTHGQADLETCRAAARMADEPRLRGLFGEVFRRMQLWDSLPRAWEAVVFDFELTLSAAAFGQLKRHRMASLWAQPYDPALGRTLPESLARAGLADAFRRELDAVDEFHARLLQDCPAAAAYILTNAHRRRARIRLNGRALGHFARLRCDAEAQWDIRGIAERMVAEVRRVMPLAGAFYGGKDCVEALRAGCAP